MFAKYSIENKILESLPRWGMSASSFGVLASLVGALPGSSKAQVCKTLAGNASFSGETATALDKLVTSLDELVTAAGPLKLDLRNPAMVAEIIQAWQAKKLTIVVTHNQ